jgi:hypothetical protein
MAAVDRHANVAVPLSGPGDLMAAVTPSDSADLANVTRAVYIGGAGDLTVINVAGITVTFKAVPVGTLLPIRVARIKATLTTASNLVALW